MARPTLFSNRKFLKLAARLQSEALALGHLEFLWHAANESGNPLLGDADDVEATARWRGTRGELASALVDCGSAGGAGFIVRIDDGRYEIHDYWHHAPDYVRKRAKREQERQDKGDEFRKNGAPLTGQKGPHTATNDQSPTGQSPTVDRSLTVQNADFQDCQSGVARTPALAPAPAPAQKEEDSFVAGATHVDADFCLNGHSSPPKRNGVDHDLQQQIVASYHEICPTLPRVKRWPERRQKKLAARIRDSVVEGKPAATVGYWRTFFEKVERSDWLSGRVGGWRCPGIEWLLEPRNFEKIIEGGHDNVARRRP